MLQKLRSIKVFLLVAWFLPSCRFVWARQHPLHSQSDQYCSRYCRHASPENALASECHSTLWLSQRCWLSLLPHPWWSPQSLEVNFKVHICPVIVGHFASSHTSNCCFYCLVSSLFHTELLPYTFHGCLESINWIHLCNENSGTKWLSSGHIPFITISSHHTYLHKW